MNPDLPYYLGFSAFPGVGPVRFKLLLDYFGSAKKAWSAPISELQSIHLGDILSRKFDAFRKTFAMTAYMHALACQHVNTLTWEDPRYPKLLREIPDAPFVLYVKCKPHSERIDMTKTIAVVGTRKATPYGISATRKITADLVRNGFTIVSGMAYGIDQAAHETAIECGGKTIAVLGCGIDIIAPPTNAHIYRKLAEGGYGAVVGEMPLGLRPNKGLFPARNRIISGLSLGVVVVEGADDSGALITAKYAGQQGRDVFAVPGPITSPGSRGPSILLKNGAVLVEGADDIFNALGVAKQKKLPHNTKRQDVTQEESAIVESLTRGPRHIDEIIGSAGLTARIVSSTLTLLELKGMVRDTGGKVYELQ